MGRHKKDYGDFPGSSEITEYLERLVGERKSDETIKTYRGILSNFFVKAGKSPSEITVEDLLNYRDRLRNSKTAGVRTYLIVLKKFFREKHGWSEDNLKKLILPRKELTLPTYLTEQEAADLLQAARYDLKNYAIFATMLYGGLRRCEVIKLDISDIDFKESTILIRKGKGGKDRIVPMNKVVGDAILQYLKYRMDNGINPKDGSNVLFVGEISDRTSTSAIGVMLRRYTLKAGIKKRISPHKLRHTALTHLYRHTGDIRFVQAIAGHAKISTTEIYTHVDTDHIRAVYEKANLDYGQPHKSLKDKRDYEESYFR